MHTASDYPAQTGLPVSPGAIFILEQNLTALFSLSSQQIVQHLPMRTIHLQAPLKAQKRPVRKAFEEEIRRQFIDTVFRECCEQHSPLADEETWRAVMKECQVHHKHPIELGGSNDFGNLVLIDRGVHTAIHNRINATIAEGDAAILKKASFAVEKRTLLGWARAYENSETFRATLSGVDKLRFDPQRGFFMDIPCPEGAVFIPQFLSRLGTATPGKDLCPAIQNPSLIFT